MVILYGLVLIVLSIYSYSLIDLNLTMFNHPLWEQFREKIITLGYFHRDISWIIYASLVALLFLFHFYFVSRYKKQNGFTLALIIGGILLLAYPFLSHDFFNYIFDARIVTHYHRSPYELFAGFFYDDPWIRFMHWTGRRYPYGPTFLPITLIPSFLGASKFLLNFIFFKMIFVFFYILAVFRLHKINNKWSLYFATQPLIIIEGLVVGHNDLMGVALAICGITYLIQKHKVRGYIFLLLSGGIKYITLPFLLYSNKNSKINYAIFIIIIFMLLFVGRGSEIQPWYFLAFFALVPFYESILPKINLFFAGLLFSYYPFIRLGGWDSREKILLKHEIIYVFLFVNVLLIAGEYFYRRLKSQFIIK